jgi:hypothetical protein
MEVEPDGSGKWYKYSKAWDLMLVPYKKVSQAKLKLPKRLNKAKYDDHASLKGRRLVAEKY